MALITSAVAAGHMPGTDGGPAERGCAPVIDARFYVGATNVSCRIARKVARGTINRRRFARWRCTYLRPSRAFGHCHGRGARRGAIAHWAVND
jgi:hypothetical protein